MTTQATLDMSQNVFEYCFKVHKTSSASMQCRMSATMTFKIGVACFAWHRQLMGFLSSNHSPIQMQQKEPTTETNNPNQGPVAKHLTTKIRQSRLRQYF